MNHDRIAEWLLESVTTRARATSMVGDLRETAASRGEIWFWRSVVATTVALMWRGMVADPRRMFGLAVRGWVAGLGFTFLIGIGAFLVLGPLLTGLTMGHSNGVGGVYGGFPTSLANPAHVAMIALCQFLVGRWIARRAPGREVSPCLAFALLQWILEGTIAIGVGLASASGGLLYLLSHSSCFLGALTIRRRARGEA
jgi:hypothetical protein